SCRDLQECDLAALESEGEPQVNGASWKISGHPARHHVTAVLFFEVNGLTGVRVLAGRIEFPSLYGCLSGVGPSLVPDYRLFGEAVRDGFTGVRISLEVGRDRLGKFQRGHGGLLFAVRRRCSLRND